ncbi:uncharacterized protein LOC113484177 isoform X1 [Athene cunicularia]|uniref:uncharacterized protein LOC113484177 isoform X1 n=1 Tax=Athene cunicularia TaxID=194338 RepID=UPI000EF652FF|nr:uncharacterized protein LOC113484177 isoform X1 [Athene cunicularia]
MGQASSSCEREMETLEFLLFNTADRFGEVFMKVSDRELQPGDIVLFPMDSRSGASSSFKHAAVYCKDGEVIHFQNTDSKNGDGRISKEGFEAMKEKRRKCWVYRKKDQIDLKDFNNKVREAMNSKAKYNLRKNNCIHFALHLLGLVDFYKELVQMENAVACAAVSIPSISPPQQGCGIPGMVVGSAKRAGVSRRGGVPRREARSPRGLGSL